MILSGQRESIVITSSGNNPMRQIKNFGDQRQIDRCVYCGGNTETREHVPSRVFLDIPYPENLPVIYACEKCNNGYSIDEEYTACLIECARIGGVSSDLIEREKIKRILSERPRLFEKLKKAMNKTKDEISFSVEANRVKRVLLKLARGHVLFEQNEPHLSEEPSLFEFGILDLLPEESRIRFEETPSLGLVPEVGSRALQQIAFSGQGAFIPWTNVQDGRYRYVVPEVGLVRMVFSEYLWCQVGWD